MLNVQVIILLFTINVDNGIENTTLN